jgi:hypothetical protein
MSSTLPVERFLDGISECSAGLATVKTGGAFFVGGPLHGIESLDFVDHGAHPLSELLHR